MNYTPSASDSWRSQVVRSMPWLTGYKRRSSTPIARDSNPAEQTVQPEPRTTQILKARSVCRSMVSTPAENFLDTRMMTKNPILSDLHATRRKLLEQSGGTVAGLVGRLQANQGRSGRVILSTRRTNRSIGAGKPSDSVLDTQTSPPGECQH